MYIAHAIEKRKTNIAITFVTSSHVWVKYLRVSENVGAMKVYKST